MCMAWARRSYVLQSSPWSRFTLCLWARQLTFLLQLPPLQNYGNGIYPVTAQEHCQHQLV